MNTHANTCSYCGRENYPDAARCFECGSLIEPRLPVPAPEPAAVTAAPKPEPQPATVEEGYRWSAKDAWKCVGMFLVFQAVLYVNTMGLRYKFPGFRHWSRSPAGELLVWVLPYYALMLLTVLYFARVNSLASFRKTFGFEKSASSYAWFGVACALLLRWFSTIILSHRWAPGISSSFSLFWHTLTPDRYLYLVSPIILAPLCEETYMRGYLYRAFRGSYPVWLSTGLLVLMAAETHLWEIRQSWLPVVTIPAITVVQCLLRERGNLWDCVLCHFVYNATILFGVHNR